jgi:8-oxo-dGTP diphosphatase
MTAGAPDDLGDSPDAYPEIRPLSPPSEVGARVETLRRIAAYGICHDETGRYLLVRASPEAGTPGVWSLPGGAVKHGENPHDTVVRETAAETGLSVAVAELRDARADVRMLPDRGVTIHTDRLLYRVTLRGGVIRERVGQQTDLCRWLSRAEACELPVRPFTAQALDLPTASADLVPEEPPDLPSFYAVPGPDGLPFAQRFAAYAVALDPAGRLLLTRIAPGYPGAGRWHLPGGGTDYGESPAPAVLRELAEETGQCGEVRQLLGAASHRDAAQIGPEGYPIDWHGVRVFYLVGVPDPDEPAVHDLGGSTVGARWFTPDELARLDLAEEVTEVTADALAAAAPWLPGTPPDARIPESRRQPEAGRPRSG